MMNICAAADYRATELNVGFRSDIGVCEPDVIDDAHGLVTAVFSFPSGCGAHAVKARGRRRGAWAWKRARHPAASWPS